MTAERFFTVGEVAKRFGINAKTVYRLVQQGDLPGFKVGTQWRFSEEMLKKWVAEQVTSGRTKRNGQDDG